MRVYVISKNGNPLMPCKPAKARHLLRDGKAKVVNRNPFTIQLLWECEENIQEVRCGIDKGCSTTGIACVGNSEILFSANVKHRNPVAVQQKEGSKTFVQVRAERRRSGRPSAKICHEKVHKTGESSKVNLKGNKVVTGMDGFKDKIAARTMQGKTLMYQELEKIAPLSCVYGYQTASFRKALSYPKEHWIDAVCIACLETGDIVPLDSSNHYSVWFRSKQTRRIFNTQPSKGGLIKQWQKYKGLASNGKDYILVDKRTKNFTLTEGYTLYQKGDVIDIVGKMSAASPTEIASINGKGKGFYYWIYQPDGNRKYASVSHKKVRLVEYAKTINYMSGDVAFIPS